MRKQLKAPAGLNELGQHHETKGKCPPETVIKLKCYLCTATSVGRPSKVCIGDACPLYPYSPYRTCVEPKRYRKLTGDEVWDGITR